MQQLSSQKELYGDGLSWRKNRGRERQDPNNSRSELGGRRDNQGRQHDNQLKDKYSGRQDDRHSATRSAGWDQLSI